ncbi:MAG: hypothetical protein ACTSU5_11680 [Promethearchaeota archaeon]
MTIVPAAVMAAPMNGDSTSIALQKEDPLAYMAILPTPNAYVTMSVLGSNQGKFTVMDWKGTAQPNGQLTVNQAGEDISYAYPQYFDNFAIDSTTNDWYPDPWDTLWMNASAYDAENDTLSPFQFNTVWNEYTMLDGSTLNVRLNSSIPIRVLYTVKDPGPKLLQLDWVTGGGTPTVNNLIVVSPTGKQVASDLEAVTHTIVGNIMNYLVFVAHEPGAYQFLIDVTFNGAAYLTLQTLDKKMANLPLDTLVTGGSSEETPNYQDILDHRWESQWFSLSGRKGDKVRLDLGTDYTTGTYIVDRWIPTPNGYKLYHNVGLGTQLVYFPKDGTAYISITYTQYYGIARYYAYATKLKALQYEVGQDRLDLRVSRDEMKAIDFSVVNDTFAWFNFTATGTGTPVLDALGTNNAFIYRDSNKSDGFAIVQQLFQKVVDGMTFRYYYFPAGSYEAVVKNTDVRYDGSFQISSGYVNDTEGGATLPMNNLTYWSQDPTSFQSVTFNPNSWYPSLKNGQALTVNVTHPGQFYLHTELRLGDNPGVCANEVVPSRVVVYNSSAGTYHDFTTEAQSGQNFTAFSTDGGNEGDDVLFLAYPRKWHDIEVNFSTPGVKSGGVDIDFHTYDGTDFNNYLSETTETTNDFTQNGTIELSLTDADYTGWVRGADFDVPGVDESDYYWLSIDVDPGDDYSTVPVISWLRLSNTSLNGDVNLAIVRESGYWGADYWNPAFGSEPTNLYASPVTNYDKATSEDALPISNMFEPGVYKLLVVPEKWSTDGNVTLEFAGVNYQTWAMEYEYNVTGSPTHPWEVNYTTFSYGLSAQFNNTEHDWGNTYVFVQCYASPYNWTQLVASIHNITSYNLYLMQDLVWVNNAPNNERVTLAAGVNTNSTFEFGVFGNFTLVFEITAVSNALVGIDIGLAQYDTRWLTVGLPLNGASFSFWTEYGLYVGIGAVAVVGGVLAFYFIRKKRRGF